MKTVLITGCSTGIGLALTKEFLKYGTQYLVFATARNEEDLEMLHRLGAQAIKLDVTSSSEIDTCVRTVLMRTQQIDILINNAGVAYTGPLIDQPMSEIETMYRTNVLGPIELTQKVVPAMISQRSGLIINISSVSSVVPIPYFGHYAATKAALTNYSEELRRELRPFDIEVVNVLAGAVESNLLSNDLSVERYQKSKYYNAMVEFQKSSNGKKFMSAETFAATLVNKVIQQKLTPSYYLGSYTTLYRVLSYFSRWILDRFFPIKV